MTATQDGVTKGKQQPEASEVPPEPWRTPYAASIVAEFS
jgi:hypothetical protein